MFKFFEKRRQSKSDPQPAKVPTIEAEQHLRFYDKKYEDPLLLDNLQNNKVQYVNVNVPADNCAAIFAHYPLRTAMTIGASGGFIAALYALDAPFTGIQLLLGATASGVGLGLLLVLLTLLTMQLSKLFFDTEEFKEEQGPAPLSMIQR